MLISLAGYTKRRTKWTNVRYDKNRLRSRLLIIQLNFYGPTALAALAITVISVKHETNLWSFDLWRLKME